MGVLVNLLPALCCYDFSLNLIIWIVWILCSWTGISPLLLWALWSSPFSKTVSVDYILVIKEVSLWGSCDRRVGKNCPSCGELQITASHSWD